MTVLRPEEREQLRQLVSEAKKARLVGTNCPWCGKELLPTTTHNRRFCSESCRKLYWQTLKREARLTTMKEATLQKAVIDHAHLLRWHVAHFRPARIRNDRWATPVVADGAGFPDLVLARDDRLIFAELKSQFGVVGPRQKEWLERLRKGPAEVYVWGPQEWKDGTIESILQGGSGGGQESTVVP
jgi:endogenous inhibitor of DNA gyrase (YacG/DUF329 family)